MHIVITLEYDVIESTAIALQREILDICNKGLQHMHVTMHPHYTPDSQLLEPTAPLSRAVNDNGSFEREKLYVIRNFLYGLSGTGTGSVTADTNPTEEG